MSLPPVAAAFEFDQGVDVKDALNSAPQSAPEPGDLSVQAAPSGRAKWTVMYFINGKNNLVSYVDPDLNHMEEVGSTDRLKILSEIGKSGESVKRRRMEWDDQPQTVTSPVAVDLGASDMGDWKTLAAFGKWAKANYPAEHYLLSIWNHGSGWLQQRPRGDGEWSTSGISYDDETGHHIKTTELAQALAAMGGVDVYASDACLMQMAEVSYELRNVAKVVVGSEDNEPAVGWNYARYLGPLARNPQMSPQQVGQAYVTAFQDSYALLGLTTTVSSLNAETFRRFIPLINAWTVEMFEADEKELVRTARRDVQSYSDSDNVDLVDFVERIGAGTRRASVRRAGQRLTDFVRRRLVTSNASTGERVAGSTGLAIYLPTGSFNEDYAQLAWARDSTWPNFARWVSHVMSETPTPKLKS
ncbi:MAG: hypothetical protein HYZ75_14685 [Elusimicrobia bacterium]|nr:hypothetical protein [Elusimicrobiota bacterium]